MPLVKHMITGKILKIWNSSPREWISGLQRRLQKAPGWEWEYSLPGLLAGRKHLNPTSLIDRWYRYWRVLEQQSPYEYRDRFKFEGRSVLEVGCGPLLGWGPFVLFKGATRFMFMEPWFRRDVLRSNEIEDLYLRPLYKELAANFRSELSAQAFYQLIHDRSQPFSDNVGPADIILSNSTLEHIPREELPVLLQQCRAACSDDAVFIHAVDFGDHQGSDKGFGSMYDGPNRPESNLNLLRKPDIEDCLMQAGFSVDRSVVYRHAPASPSHADWNNYALEDLQARVVLFIGRANGNSRVG